MAVEKDLFGFDELEKSFSKLSKKYPNAADALLMAQGQAVNKETKANTPVKTKKLRNSWRLKKVKLYKGGTVRVVRIQSAAPHAHLVEEGHENVRGGSIYSSKGKSRSVSGRRKLNGVQRAYRGISSHGHTEGKFMLENAMRKARTRFDREAQKMLDKITEDLQI